jgi:hypothetical protein
MANGTPASAKLAAVQRAAARTATPASATVARALPAGSVWGARTTAPKPAATKAPEQAAVQPLPAARRAALSVALEAIKAAGGCAELELSVSEALDKTVQAVADSRPLGARLDSCRARLVKAEARRAQTAAAIELAMARHEEATQEIAACQASLAELEREVAAPAVVEPGMVASGTQELLTALEGCSQGLPERVVACMQSLHSLLGNLELPDGDASMFSDGFTAAEGSESTVGATSGATQEAAPTELLGEAEDAAARLVAEDGPQTGLGGGTGRQRMSPY